MRFPVYRNLDKPFQILGYSALELVVLCVALVGGGEVTRALGIPRVWAFVFTAVLALTIFWLRRSLGDLFFRRLVRFLTLPSHVYPKIFNTEKMT